MSCQLWHKEVGVVQNAKTEANRLARMEIVPKEELDVPMVVYQLVMMALHPVALVVVVVAVVTRVMMALVQHAQMGIAHKEV